MKTTVEKRRLLIRSLSEYYTAIDGIPDVSPATRLRNGFPHLVRLFKTLKDLHPFLDGNTRTRNVVLQTEFVQLGGHPIMMTNHKDVYFCITEKGVADILLAGWCDWEVVARLHISPFLLRDFNGSAGDPSCSRAPVTYDAASDTCVE